MAGSLNHIVGSDGKFKMDTIENLGDAWEALEECFELILHLAKGDTKIVSRACEALGYPDPWKDEYGDDFKEVMTTSRSKL